MGSMESNWGRVVLLLLLLLRLVMGKRAGLWELIRFRGDLLGDMSFDRYSFLLALLL